MQLRAAADARLLPAAARPRFVAGFAQATRSGLQVGRGQSVASPPRGVPPQLIPELRQLIRDVFTHGYIAAIRPTLAISVAVLLAGAAGCLLLRRHTATATSSPAEATSRPAEATRSPAEATSAPTEMTSSSAAVTSSPAEAANPPTVTRDLIAGG
jgi:hypothetical protein